MKSINPWACAIRDFFIPFMPGWLVSTLIKRYNFAFIAHPLVLEDLAKQYPNLEGKNKDLLKFISKYLWPVLGAEITGFNDKNGKAIKGIVLFCPMSTRLLVLRRQSARKKLLKIVRIAEKLKVEIIGLGAYVPIVTYDGKLLAKRTTLNMTTGTSFSAIIAVKNSIKLIEKCRLDKKDVRVAIVGAGGSVGSICTRLMMDYFDNFILIDKKDESLNAFLKSEYIGGISNKILTLSNKISDVKHAHLIIVTTNTPGVILRSEHLTPGTLVVDAAQPRNVSAKIPFLRKDVIVIESGVAVVPGLNTHFKFDLRAYNEVYSCLAEVLILLWSKMAGKQVGKFTLSYVYELARIASEIGIDVPQFRNGKGYIDDFNCQTVGTILLRRLESDVNMAHLSTNGKDGSEHSYSNRIIKLYA